MHDKNNTSEKEPHKSNFDFLINLFMGCGFTTLTLIFCVVFLVTIGLGLYFSISVGIQSQTYHLWQETSCKVINIANIREVHSRYTGSIYFYKYLVNYEASGKNQTEITKDDIALKFALGSFFPCYYDTTTPKSVSIHHIRETGLPLIILSILFFFVACFSFVIPIFLAVFCLATFACKKKINFIRMKEEDPSTIIY